MSIKELESLYQNITVENSGEFIWAIRSMQLNRSVQALVLQASLCRIIDNFEPEGRRICQSTEPISTEDSQRMLIHGKILAALLLILMETRSYKEAGARLLTFLEYAACCTKGYNDLAIPALKSICRNCIELTYSWENVRDAQTLELLAYQICNASRFSSQTNPPLSFSGKGYIQIGGDTISVSSTYVGEAGVKAWESCDGRIRVLTRNARDEKLKASDVDDAARLDDFARIFRMTQSDESHATSSTRFQDIRKGKKAVIECTGIDEDENGPILLASALNTKDQLNGSILNEELIKGTYTEDLVDYIFDGDCIDGAVVEETGDNPLFSIKAAYENFAKQTARQDEKNFAIFEAKCIQVREDVGRINWLTARGYGANSMIIDGVKEGDIAVMEVHSVQTNNNWLYVNVIPPRNGYDHIDYRFNDDDVLSSFIISKKAAYELTSASPSVASGDASKEAFRRIAGILLRSSAGIHPLEQYRRCLTAGFIYNCIGDEEGLSRSQQQAIYLGLILRFAQGDNISIPAGVDLSKSSLDILDCLSCVGKNDVDTILSGHIHSTTDPSCRQIASLLLAQSISDQYEDEVKADADDIRRKVCNILGLDSCFCSQAEKRIGKYGHGESQTLEFKASYVMRNDGKGADLDYQGRGQVFEAVCAFLNGDGGTLYIGVNDKTGDPIISEEYGIKGDMKWLCNNYGAVNSMRSRQLGHNVIKPDTIDHYALFLCSEKELFFKKSLHNNIIIEPTEDEDAIRITVRPSLYEIAYLYRDNTFSDGQAFTRNGNRTVRMSKTAMERRLMNLKQLSKEVQFIVAINEAIDRKHKLIFRGYHSGNSGEIRDRYVVPINLFYNDENVLCYDFEAKAERQFRLSRITSIDSDVPDAYYPHCFEPKTADVFRWISDENYHIKISMEVGALNYLLEEYSNAKNLPEQELYQTEDGRWILDTVLHGLGGICRFYLGLADKITILPSEDSDKLKDYIRTFLKSADIINL